ncbi:hypothetical protein D3C85_1945310 [compost metagenome]
MGDWLTRSLKGLMSSSNSSRMTPVALVRFMVQISGSQPPLEEQKVATDASALIFGWSA